MQAQTSLNKIQFDKDAKDKQDLRSRVQVCVCVREREREREIENSNARSPAASSSAHFFFHCPPPLFLLSSAFFFSRAQVLCLAQFITALRNVPCLSYEMWFLMSRTPHIYLFTRLFTTRRICLRMYSCVSVRDVQISACVMSRLYAN